MKPKTSLLNNLETNQGMLLCFCILSTVLGLIYLGQVIFDYSDAKHLFFRDTQDLFADFYNNIEYSQHLDPYKDPMFGTLEKPYPPLAYCVFFGMYKLGELFVPEIYNVIHLAATLFLTVSTLLFFEFLRSSMKSFSLIKYWFLACLFLSGLYLSSFERGNLVLLSAACVSFYLFYFNSESALLKYCSLFMLAFAAGIKLTPAILGLLLLGRKDRKSVVILVLLGILFCLVPFAFFPEGFNEIKYLLKNISDNGVHYGVMDKHIGMYHYMGYICRMSRLFNVHILYSTLLPYFTYFWMIVSIPTLIFFFYEKTLWRRALMLIMLMIFIPRNCGNYNALYLFPVMVLFFNEKQHPFSDWFYVVFFTFSITGFFYLNKFETSSFLWNVAYAELLVHSGKCWFASRRNSVAQDDLEDTTAKPQEAQGLAFATQKRSWGDEKSD